MVVLTRYAWAASATFCLWVFLGPSIRCGLVVPRFVYPPISTKKIVDYKTHYFLFFSVVPLMIILLSKTISLSGISGFSNFSNSNSTDFLAISS